jgi:glycosyltransferase involved in cell wall biosynthesis
MKHTVSVIIPIYNVEKYLVEAIESVVQQSIGFIQQVQLILVNDGSTDTSAGICLEYRARFPLNILYIRQENNGVSAARNAGLRYATGEYICFLDGDDKYELNFLEEALRFMKAHEGEIDCVAVPIFFFEARDGEHEMNDSAARAAIVNIDRNDNPLPHNVSACMFYAKGLQDIWFKENVRYMEDGEFVTRVLLHKRRYGYLSATRFWYRMRETHDSVVDRDVEEVSWYERIETVYQALIVYAQERCGEVPRYVQNLIAYDCRLFRLRTVPAAVDVNHLKSVLRSVLSNIDDEIILGQKQMDWWDKIGLLKIKQGKPVLHQGGLEALPYFTLGKAVGAFHPVWMQITEEYDHVAHFAGFYDLLDYDEVQLEARYRGRVYASETNGWHVKQFYYLGQMVHAAKQFDIYIPVEESETIAFFYRTTAGRILPARLEYTPESRLSGGESGVFIVNDHTIISRTAAEHVLYVEELTRQALCYYTRRCISGYI